MLEELITITKFLSLGEAKLAQGKLVSAGISAFVCDENMHAMNWHMGMALGGIRLQVPDSQVVRALEVLDDFEPEPARGGRRRGRVGGGCLLPGVRVAGDSRGSQSESAPDHVVVGRHSLSRAAGAGDASLEMPGVRVSVAGSRRVSVCCFVQSGVYLVARS